jgi:hypothetical protein
MAPAGRHGVLNDAIAIYFNDATLAGSYVAGGAGYKAESTDGASRYVGTRRRCVGATTLGNYPYGESRPDGEGAKAPPVARAGAPVAGASARVPIAR